MTTESEMKNGRGDLVKYRAYNDCTLFPQTIDEILNIHQEEKLVLFPSAVNFGFDIGFHLVEIYHDAPGLEPYGTHVISFLEKQLPEKYTFETLRDSFMSEENIKRAQFIGIDKKIKPVRSHYDY
jgi:hypothetical protein